MNKLYLWGVIVTVAMLGFTYVSVIGSKGGLNGDIVNMLAIGGAVAIVVTTVFVVIKYVRQMQEDTASGELVEEEWDGIGEYKNPIPRGWGILFLLSMVWGMWYFTIGYPVNSYSQIGEYNKDTAEHNAKFEKKYEILLTEYKANDKTENDLMVDMGESVFLAECKICHGLTADGIDGTSANLNVRLEEKVVKYHIINGSNSNLMGSENPMPDRYGIMNANTEYAPITDAEIDVVSAYVANGMRGEGSDVFAGACAACHGPDGTGMEYVAPNIAKYSTELVVNVLNNGKKGVIGAMPVFKGLNTKQKEAVGAYVTSLSE